MERLWLKKTHHLFNEFLRREAGKATRARRGAGGQLLQRFSFFFSFSPFLFSCSFFPLSYLSFFSFLFVPKAENKNFPYLHLLETEVKKVATATETWW